MVEFDKPIDHMVVESSIPLDIEMQLIDYDVIAISLIVTTRLDSPRGAIFLDGELCRITSSLLEESDSYVDRF